MTAAELAERLDARPTGPGRWQGRCPAHDDRQPSLSIAEGEREGVEAVLSCHAGCPSEEIVAAAGLEWSDLFEGRSNGKAAKPKRKPPPPEPLPDEEQITAWQKALLANDRLLGRLRSLKGWTKVACEQLGLGFDGERIMFPIFNAGGEVANIVKYQPGGKPKSLALRGCRRDLFPAPEAIDGEALWLVEGENDAVTAAVAGLRAVGVPGANGWRSEYAARFEGRRVAVCFDCDASGRKLAERVSGDLEAAGVEHRVVDLDPERSDGFDLGDYVLGATTVGEARDGLLTLAKAAPVKCRPAPAADTRELLDNIASTIRRFVILNDAQRYVQALWVLHAHAIDAADATPYLSISSPEKQSGKSRNLEVLAQLVPRPMEAVNASDAALFRALAAEGGPATLLYDEVDCLFGPRAAASKEEQRGLINAGWRRNGVAWRCVGEGSKQESIPFPVWGPKVLAGIGELPETIADRCIPIRLRRRRPDEAVERGRYKRIQGACAPSRLAAERWAAEHVDTLRDAEPALPEELSDRAQDGAEPLLAIADLAGGDWPSGARTALVKLHSSREDEGESWGVRLLADVKAAFREGEEELATAELIERLKGDEEAPWCSWGKDDSGLSPRQIAGLLKPYEVKSTDVHVEAEEGRKTLKGYARQSFEDAWDRYLPSLEGHPKRAKRANGSSKPKTEGSDPRQDEGVARIETGRKPHGNADGADGALEAPNRRDRGGQPELASTEEEAEAERIAAKLGEGAA